MTSTKNKKYRSTGLSDGVEMFLDLSIALTGFTRLELWGTGLVETYYDEVNLIIGEREMGKLIGESSDIIQARKPITKDIEQLIEEKILDNSRYGPVARNIIRLWYLGSWSQLPQEWRNEYGATSYDTDHVISSQSYEEGLVWIAGGAHPMGAKPQGFGAWAQPGSGEGGGAIE